MGHEHDPVSIGTHADPAWGWRRCVLALATPNRMLAAAHAVGVGLYRGEMTGGEEGPTEFSRPS